MTNLEEWAEDVGAGEGQQDEGEEGGEAAVEHGRSCSHSINHYMYIIIVFIFIKFDTRTVYSQIVLWTSKFADQ